MPLVFEARHLAPMQYSQRFFSYSRRDASRLRDDIQSVPVPARTNDLLRFSHPGGTSGFGVSLRLHKISNQAVVCVQQIGETIVILNVTGHSDRL